jgi:hypothetical protein
MDGYKTYGGIGLMIFSLLQTHGLATEIGEADKAAIIEGVIALIGIVLAIYGRIDVGQRLEKAESKPATVTVLEDDNLPG